MKNNSNTNEFDRFRGKNSKRWIIVIVIISTFPTDGAVRRSFFFVRFFFLRWFVYHRRDTIFCFARCEVHVHMWLSQSSLCIEVLFFSLSYGNELPTSGNLILGFIQCIRLLLLLPIAFFFCLSRCCSRSICAFVCYRYRYPYFKFITVFLFVWFVRIEDFRHKTPILSFVMLNLIRKMWPISWWSFFFSSRFGYPFECYSFFCRPLPFFLALFI